jgi:hypothetical protein
MSNQQSINMLKIPTTLAVYLFVCMGVFCQNQPMEFHKWALRPPMGWNSYDCFGAAVNEAEVKGNADIMAAHLKDAGWEYIVIDYCWYYPLISNLPSHSTNTAGCFRPRTAFPPRPMGQDLRPLGNIYMDWD